MVRSLRTLGGIAAVAISAGCADQSNPCGWRDIPTVPVQRVGVADSATGMSINSIATVQRIDMDSPVVPVLDWGKLPDPTRTGGLGPMRVRISAPGYASRELSFPQSCTLPPEPLLVLLPRR